MLRKQKKERSVKFGDFLHIGGAVCLNTIFVIIDFALIAVFLYCLFLSIILLLALLTGNTQITDYVKTMLFLCNDENLKSNLISFFGVFVQITIIPLISLFLTVLLSIKEQNKRKGEQFAKSHSVKFYLATVPFGVNNDVCIMRDDSLKYPLAYYDYCLSLVFENEIFQAYELTVEGIEFNNKFVDKQPCESVVLDDTGIIFNGKEIGGTQISTFVKNDEINMPETYYIKQVAFYLKMKQRVYTAIDMIKNMFFTKRPIIYVFPLLRVLYKTIVYSLQKHRVYKIELIINSTFEEMNDYGNKLNYLIHDINIIYERKKFRKDNTKKRSQELKEIKRTTRKKSK